MAREPIKWKSKIILVKLEAANAYGVDPAPTGAANAMLMTDVQIQPMEGEDVSRNIELPYMGAQEDLSTAYRAILTGSVELVGSGTPGTPPAWAPLLRACGVAEVVTPNTSVDYSPVTDGHESAGIHFYIGPSRHVILGSRGTAVVTANANGIPVARLTITGLFVTPSDNARPTPDLTKFQRPQVASKANTPVFKIDGIDFVMRNFEMNLGCDVQFRALVGVERVVIVDKAESITTTVEAVPLAVYNPYQRALPPAPRVPIVLEHGTVAGRIFSLSVPTAVQKRPGGPVNGQGVVEWPLGFTPLPTAGDDQWKLTLK